MPDTKVSALTAVTSNGAATDEYMVNALGTSKKTTLQKIMDFIAATIGSMKVTGTLTASGRIQGAIVETAITTVGTGVLTAAGLVGGVIRRSGSVAGYADATDTATNIVAAIPNVQVGTSFDVTIINTVAFADTITAGAGVTLAGTTAIGASTWRRYIGTVTNVGTPAVTFTGVGAGTL